MSKEEDNKAIVGRWFTDFWGETCNLDIVDEIAAPDMLLHYSLHEPRRGHADIKAFMTDPHSLIPNVWRRSFRFESKSRSETPRRISQGRGTLFR